MDSFSIDRFDSNLEINKNNIEGLHKEWVFTPSDEVDVVTVNSNNINGNTIWIEGEHSKENILNLPEVNDFIKGFSEKQNFTWVMGDGGAHEHLPRITCHSFKNHRFIVNGIGEVEDDTVIILHDGKIFSHIIE